MKSQEALTRILANCERLKAASASLRCTVERWQPSWENPMRAGLGSEHYILKKWERQPHSFHTLPSGEIVQFGSKSETDAHSMRTQYLRSNYNAADASYLEQCASASYVITAEHADALLRKVKPNTSRAKRAPLEADDPYMPEWRNRPEQHFSARDLVMQSGLKGRALQRELARLK